MQPAKLCDRVARIEIVDATTPCSGNWSAASIETMLVADAMGAGTSGFCQLRQQELVSLASLTDCQMRVYVSIATARNSRTLQTPPISYALIASVCGKSKETVRQRIRELVIAGAVTKTQHGKRFVYGFPMAKPSKKR